MITTKKVDTKKDLIAFVKFPFTLFKDSPYWVPPLVSEELETFNKTKNPAFDDAEATLFLAYKSNRIVGRVACIVNKTEVNDKGEKRMRFGWFDVIDDIEVTKALLNEVETIGRQNNLDFIEGPMGFSNLDKVGILTEGFDELGSMATWYSHPYYAEHFKQLGFSIEKEYQENKFSFEGLNIKKYFKAESIIKKRFGVRHRPVRTKEEVMRYADKMFDLFNQTYSDLPTFIKVSDVQKQYLKKKFVSFIDPEYIGFVEDNQGELIAFGVVLPSFAEALQKAKGKLFPLGWYHLLKAKKNHKTAVLYLIGIDPRYQNKGVTSLIFTHFYRAFDKKGITECIRTPELENNLASIQIWKHFNSWTFKRRKTFKRAL